MGMVYNTLGITVTPKDGEMFYFDFCLDNEDAATLNAPRSLEAFKEAKTLKKLLDVLDGCFCINDDEIEEVDGTLKKLVDFYDYDNLYPKFKKKINALKTPDKIACITVFTNNDWNYSRERRYEWVKYDFVENTVKYGVDTAKAVDSRCIKYEPSETEMFRILAGK